MGGVKKSVYVFLCSLLGVLLFLILQRIAIFAYLLLVAYGIVAWSSGFDYVRFMAVDYTSLVLMLLFGSWYGIWLGTHWYDLVYESGTWRGGWYHAKHHLFPWRKNNYRLKDRVEEVKTQLERDLDKVEILAAELPKAVMNPEPIRRRVTRRRPAARRTVLAKSKI